MTVKTQTLQAATVIAKTGETVVGGEIPTGHYDYLTLLFSYVKGDETGLDIYPYFLLSSGGTEYQLGEWETDTGVYSVTQQKLELTATINGAVTFDVRGIPYMKFYQGGSNNDGTPTGTLAAGYILK